MNVPMESVSLEQPEPVAEGANDASIAQSGDNHEALIQAFLKGAGLPNVTIGAGLTPELMETIGRLLAIAVQGTVELSELRSLVKREVNADMTVVVVRNNNPVKFFADGQTVLTQMLRKKMPGFMGPVEAMEDAYLDLQAHQRGVVVGVRAAMRDLLRRIKPSAFEADTPMWPVIDTLFPVFRQARMWNKFKERFKDLKRDSRDDFQALFGKAFLAAYEQEVERYKSEITAKHG